MSGHRANLPQKSLTSRDGLDLGKPSLEDEMMKLFEKLVYAMEQAKRIRTENVSSNIVFQIYGMTKNSMSKVFSESATWVSSEVVDTLLEQGIIQRVVSEDDEKYALTFKGIAQCVQIRYGKSLEEQFLKFLELSDQKFNTTEQTQLLWKEKLACLSLILLASTSPSSAIRLNDEANKAVLTEAFQKALACLKNYGMVRKEVELKTVSRGESPVSALMSRLNALPRKTNHYYKYIGRGSEYFLDIERNGQVVEKKVSFLLKRIFEKYNPDCNYGEMYRELAEISQLYYPRFRARSVNSTIVLSILRRLKDFMDKEILHLPLQINLARAGEI